jgi:hypothetical protein
VGGSICDGVKEGVCVDVVIYSILDAVAKSGKAPFRLIMSVRMYKVGSLWTDFREVVCWTLLLKCVKRVHICLKSNKNAGLFIMFSMITNIYNKKTKGRPTLMELFTATGKLKKFFLHLELFDVSTVVHTSDISSCQKNFFISFPVAVNNSVKVVRPLGFFS